MSLPAPTDNSSIWMWISGVAASVASALVLFLFGWTNTKIGEVRTEAKANLAEYKADVTKELEALQAAILEGQRQHVQMLTGLNALPTRSEMQHDLEVMEERLGKRIDTQLMMRKT